MRILIKYPVRFRLNQALDTLKDYVDFADDMSQIKIIVSIDDDDKNMDPALFRAIHPNIDVFSGPSKGKVDACNRDIPDTSTFDILFLGSDDMKVIEQGYDTRMRDAMTQYFPDLDGVLFMADDYQGYQLNTAPIMGNKYYERFGYIYYPGYKSLFCDQEFMDVSRKLCKQVYFHKAMFKHMHPFNGYGIKNDDLYNSNELPYSYDDKLYQSRKEMIHLSVLICTIPDRWIMLKSLLEDIAGYTKNLALNVQVLSDIRTDITIGEKRQSLLVRAKGKYCAFIDDDDKVSPNYFNIIQNAVFSGTDYDCVALNGRYYMNGKFVAPFYHSIKYSEWSNDSLGYYRCPNHLNPIKTDICRKIGFVNKSWQEDKIFSESLKDSGLLKTEYSCHKDTQYLYYKVE